MRFFKRFRYIFNNKFPRISKEIDYLKNERESGDKIAPIWEQLTTPGAVSIKGILVILLVAAFLCVIIFPLLSK